MAKKTLRTSSNEVIGNLRKLSIAALRSGKQQQEVASLFGVGLSTLKEWVRQYKLYGSKSFTLKKRGAKCGSKDLSSADLRAIKHLMTEKLPDQLKLPFVLWTREAVQAIILKKYGVKKSLSQVARYLNSWGFSSQKPIYKAYEQNPAAVQEWLTNEFPKIKAKAKAENSEIYFGDEAGLRSDHHAGKSYAPKGKTPIIKRTAQRFTVNMISAISARGGKRFMLFRGKFNADRYILFLSQLIKKAPRKILLIMDNYSVHKTLKVKAWIERHKDKLEVYYLPTYSPELNPDELLNQDIKTNVVGKLRAGTPVELAKNVKTHLKKMSAKKVMSFFKHQQTRYAA